MAPRKKSWHDLFLASLAEIPDVSKACAAAGVTRSAAYKARQHDEDFALAWADTIEASLDKLENALMARALKSDTVAAIFLLKAHRPEKYRENMRVEHTGTVRHEVHALSMDELEAIADGIHGKRAVTD